MSEVTISKLKLELDELSEKYQKLDKFLDTDKFINLDTYIKNQMIDQHKSMLDYKWALSNRIDYMAEQLKEKGK